MLHFTASSIKIYVVWAGTAIPDVPVSSKNGEMGGWVTAPYSPKVLQSERTRNFPFASPNFKKGSLVRKSP